MARWYSSHGTACGEVSESGTRPVTFGGKNGGARRSKSWCRPAILTVTFHALAAIDALAENDAFVVCHVPVLSGENVGASVGNDFCRGTERRGPVIVKACRETHGTGGIPPPSLDRSPMGACVWIADCRGDFRSRRFAQLQLSKPPRTKLRETAKNDSRSDHIGKILHCNSYNKV